MKGFACCNVVEARDVDDADAGRRMIIRRAPDPGRQGVQRGVAESFHKEAPSREALVTHAR